MATCDTLTLKTFRVSQLSSYTNIDNTDYLLIIESGSLLYSRKTTIGDFVAYVVNSGLTGSYTGSFTGSAILDGEFSGTFSGSVYGTASNAISSSYGITSSYSVLSADSISSSYSVSSSISNESISASYSLLSDDAVSSSYALSASHSEQSDNSITASYSLSSSYIIPSTTVITSTVYFDRQKLSDVGGFASVNATSVNAEGLPPTPLTTDWTAFDINAAINDAGVSLPVAYPKSAILNVYHSSSIAQISGYANTYGFFTSHVLTGWGSSRSNYTLQGAWGGEDARAAIGYYVYGDVYYARMSGTSNYIYVQYSELFNPGGATARTNINIDLIGVQY